MRNFDPATAAALAQPHKVSHLLFWVQGVHRVTGQAGVFGFWTGPDHRTFTIDGVARDYLGAGAVIRVPPLVTEMGLTERTNRLKLSGLATTTADILRAWTVEDQPIEVRRAWFDPATNALIAEPVLEYDGRCTEAKLVTEGEGGPSTVDLSFIGGAWRLLRGLALRKSDAALRARAPGDGFRRYIDVTGQVEVTWMEKTARAPGAAPDGPTFASPGGGDIEGAGVL